jgi:hypothetical protein
MKALIYKIALIILFSFNCKAQNKVYTINIISDISCSKNKTDIENSVLKINSFFSKYNIQFLVKGFMVSKVAAKDKTLDNTLEEFCNCNPGEYHLTLAVVGEHNGAKIGIAYFGTFGTKYSCAAVDLGALTGDKETYVIIHEILHLMGLRHSEDSYNIMCNHTNYNNVTLEQEEVIKQYGYITK